jgi:hypothetical protein
VVHQVGRAGNRSRRERQLLEQARIRARRGWDRRARLLVEVVREPDRNAACLRLLECRAQDVGERIGEPDVVDRDVERPLRLREPAGEEIRDLVGLLAAVSQRADVDRRKLSAGRGRLRRL